MHTLHHLSDETIYITFRNGNPIKKGQTFSDFIREDEHVKDGIFMWEDGYGNEELCCVKDRDGNIILECDALNEKTGRVQVGDDTWEIKTIDDCDDDEIEKVEKELSWDCDILAYCTERRGKHFVYAIDHCGDNMQLRFTNGESMNINAMELEYFDDEDDYKEALIEADDICEYSAEEVMRWVAMIWPNAKYAGEEDDDNE